MKTGESLLSQNGVYRLVLNDTRNLEIWCKREKLWMTNVDVSYMDSLIFDNDGQFYLLGKNKSYEWKLEILSANSKAHLMLIRNDGNLAVYNKCGDNLWESRTKVNCDTIPGIYIYQEMSSTKRIPAVIFSRPVVTLAVMFSVVIGLIHFYDSKHVNTVSIRLCSRAILIIAEEL